MRRHVSTDAAHAYGGSLATFTAWCEHHQILYQGVPASMIKKHATGEDNVGEEDVVVSVTTRGHAPIDDSEVGALALLHWAIQRHDGGREV